MTANRSEDRQDFLQITGPTETLGEFRCLSLSLEQCTQALKMYALTPSR